MQVVVIMPNLHQANLISNSDIQGEAVGKPIKTAHQESPSSISPFHSIITMALHG